MVSEKTRALVTAAKEIVARMTVAGIPTCLLGGVAVCLRCPSASVAPLAREINDVDVAIARTAGFRFDKAMHTIGFEPDRWFNGLHGEERMLFARGDVEVDVFVGRFHQCHSLDLDSSLASGQLTISLASLLMTKLQIVQINQKDLLDILALFADHDVDDRRDDEAISLDEILSVTTIDWGWHTTVEDNLAKAEQLASELLGTGQGILVHERVQKLVQAMDTAPKSLKWKVRARIGRKMPWYELPEEKK
jgi:hypothetical protein